MNNQSIIISGCRENNLKNVSLTIPKGKLTVFTGVSGSGKSTLALDVIYQECQRQFLEAIGYQGIRKPKVDHIRNVSPAIRITQTEVNKNPRSTVGTVTNIYTDLRMVYEKLGVRVCPHCGELISAADCREEVERQGDEFKVYMYCCHCQQRMDKLTRTHFSHNTREGGCPRCQGLGKVLTIDQSRVVNEELSLEAGAVDYWEQIWKDYQIPVVYAALCHYGVPVAPHTPVAAYSPEQRLILYHGVESDRVQQAFPDIRPPKTVAAGKFEGVLTVLWRRMSDKGGDAQKISPYFDETPCPDCHGERLSELSRSVTVAGTRLPELAALSLGELHGWLLKLEDSLTPASRQLVESYLLDLRTKLQRIIKVGLGYLTLDRQTITLSGGELQRIKLSAALDSDLTGVIYVLDEPTVGLHPKDTAGIIAILEKLRDLGNTVIVIEHDPDVMQAADYLVDIGPGSGKHGGEIIATGTLEELKRQPASVTGAYLRSAAEGNDSHPWYMRPCRISSQPHPDRAAVRVESGEGITIRNAHLYNLQHIDANIPSRCLTVVTGVSGSGKSTLVFETLAEAERLNARDTRILGLKQFDQIVTIEQAAITKMKRSNVATYSEVYTEIRKLFAGLPEARDRGLSAKHFSFNTPGGRCERCEGLGYVTSNMLFFEDIEVTCPVCNGNQFSDEVLLVKYNGHSIKDILRLSIEEALAILSDHPKINRILQLLNEVGLGYLTLGQPLTTLSGGEGQRLKLAKELITSTGQHSLYLMDEPTTGLHPVDVDHL
ncbi:MAG: ATP-binding cassette domain-containing protein, partial [Bacillota bacterium]